VTLKCLRATIVAVEKQKVCIFSVAFVAMGIQHAMRMRPTVICGLSGSTVFSNTILQMTRFKEES
jgi:hypothetical protein